jgi:hypothetical protein
MALSPSQPNSVYIVWNEAPVWGGDVGPQLGSEVLLGRSDNGGKSFHPIVNLNKDSEYTFVYHTDIAVSGGNVYLVWNHIEDEGSDVRFVRSTDAGITFDVQVELVPRTYPISIENKMFDIVYNASDRRARISGVSFPPFLSMVIGIEGMDGGDQIDITFPTELLDLAFTGHAPELYVDGTLKKFEISNMTCDFITMRFQADNSMEQIYFVAGDALGDHVHPRPQIFQPATILRVGDEIIELFPELDSRICNYELDTEAKAIIFDLERATERDTSTFAINIPDNFLGGNYTILADGQTINHTAEFISYANTYPLSFQNYTRVTFEYNSNATSLEIVGTRVIPEFGSTLALIIMTVAIIVAITTTKRFKTE